jgi:hypothetical protein
MGESVDEGLQPVDLVGQVVDVIELVAFGDDLVEKAGGESGGCAAGDAGDGSSGDRIVCGEVLDGVAGGDVDEDGVDLYDLSGGAGLEPPGQPPCVAVVPIRRKRRPPEPA